MKKDNISVEKVTAVTSELAQNTAIPTLGVWQRCGWQKISKSNIVHDIFLLKK